MNVSVADRVPRSSERVAMQTNAEALRRIERELIVNVCYYQSHPDEIEARLDELSREWDIERVLETNAATLTLTGLTFSALFGKRWLLLSAAVSGFLLQHGVQGWCPPLPVLRRMGFRTRDEIRTEMLALQGIRGDLDDLAQASDMESRELVGSVRRWRPSGADGGAAVEGSDAESDDDADAEGDTEGGSDGEPKDDESGR